MTYLENIDVKFKELSNVVPRISLWDSETVSLYEKQDLVSLQDQTYGNLPVSVYFVCFVSVFTICIFCKISYLFFPLL